MKAHLTRVSLALLPMVFLLSCQDSGTGPVGPDGLVPQFHAAHVDTCEGHDKKDNPNCGGGGGGEPTEPDATVVLSGGLITDGAEDVQIRKDNRFDLVLWGENDGFTSQIDLNATFTAGLGACSQAGDLSGDGALMTPGEVLRLIDDGSSLSRAFFAAFDKSDPDNNPRIGFSWGDGAGATANLDVNIAGLFKGDIAPPTDDQPPFSLNPSVTVIREGDTSEFTFLANSGLVSIWQRGGGPRLVCPLRDEIVMLVDRK